MHPARIHVAVPVTIGLGVLLTLAACGTNTPTASPAGNGSTVAVLNVSGQPVLVDQAGVALYTNDQDSATTLRCATSDCTAIWSPLTVPGGSQPTTGSGVTGTVATMQRPDGSHQVTLNGKPLYTFSFDHGPGKVTGDGTQDNFGGTAFTWHTALTSGGTSGSGSSQTGGGYPNGNGY
jgi:predicted lipoprotein with Yx(FWY)xxD motif